MPWLLLYNWFLVLFCFSPSENNMFFSSWSYEFLSYLVMNMSLVHSSISYHFLLYSHTRSLMFLLDIPSNHHSSFSWIFNTTPQTEMTNTWCFSKYTKMKEKLLNKKRGIEIFSQLLFWSHYKEVGKRHVAIFFRNLTIF